MHLTNPVYRNLLTIGFYSHQGGDPCQDSTVQLAGSKINPHWGGVGFGAGREWLPAEWDKPPPKWDPLLPQIVKVLVPV